MVVGMIGVYGLQNVVVKFFPEGRKIEVPLGSSLLEAALRANVDLASLCGGRGVCGKCKVQVIDGFNNLSPYTNVEKMFLEREKIDVGFRLACQARLLGPVVVKIPESSRMGKQKLVILGFEPQVTIAPSIRKLCLEIEKPTLDKPEADDIRLLRKLLEQGYGPNIRISYTAVKKLPIALRSCDGKVTVTLRLDDVDGVEVIDVEAGNTSHRIYGYAVDIGTTKIAGFLVDLTNGSLVYADGIMNPQIPYGEDVVSRITYAMKNLENLGKLKEEVVKGINELIEKACSIAQISNEEIYEVVIVGNTVMHHLFFGLDPRYLGLSPYPPVLARPYATKALSVGLKVNREAYVYSLPNIAAFIGADAVGDILVSGIHEMNEVALLIDVGTNTEVILGCKDFLYACSTASGPAFEGTHIKFGMRASSGAIESVSISNGGLEVSYKTIDDVKPRGLCGSGIVDAIAEMLKEGVIDTSGKIIEKTDNPRIRRGPQGLEYVLVWREETAYGSDDIVITQQDVREIQKAKAAIQTGWRTLLKRASISVKEVKKVFIAGAFGTYINPTSAMIIGMLPEISLDRVEFIGNAAGSGARLALKSIYIRREAEMVARRVKYIELAADPEFEIEYINSMSLPYADLSMYPEVAKKIKAPCTSKIYRKHR